VLDRWAARARAHTHTHTRNSKHERELLFSWVLTESCSRRFCYCRQFRPISGLPGLGPVVATGLASLGPVACESLQQLVKNGSKSVRCVHRSAIDDLLNSAIDDLSRRYCKDLLNSAMKP
jgi:hypothetical protein